MFYVNNKFANHGNMQDISCETRDEAESEAKIIAGNIAELFRRFESDGEWEVVDGGRRYNPPENGHCRVGDAAYWEWYDRVIADVGDDGILTEDVLMQHCMDAVEITESGDDNE